MARRAQILDGAAKVFAEKGYHAATTREIAEAADVSEGSIYHYFDSKEDLLIEIMGNLTVSEVSDPTGTLKNLLHLPTDDIRGVMETVLQWRQNFVTKKQPMLRAVVSEILINEDFARRYYEEFLTPNLEMTERFIQKQIDSGELRDVDAALFARVYIAANFGLFELLFLGDPLLEKLWGTGELGEAIVSFYLDGLLPRETSKDTEA